jgi:hypothetical protein
MFSCCFVVENWKTKTIVGYWHWCEEWLWEYYLCPPFASLSWSYGGLEGLVDKPGKQELPQHLSGRWE